MFVSPALITIVGLLWTAMLAVAVWQNRRARRQEDQDKLLRQIATIVLGPADQDDRRQGGLVDAFEEHCRQDEQALANIDTYTRTFKLKIAKLYRKLGWGSDEYVLAQIDAELRGEVVEDRIVTGAHPVIDPHALPALSRPALQRRHTPINPPIRREEDDDPKRRR
jgi:hypothetical protein